LAALGNSGTTRSTITPTRAVHSGPLLLTASAIVDSSSPREIDRRLAQFGFSLFQFHFQTKIFERLIFSRDQFRCGGALSSIFQLNFRAAGLLWFSKISKLSF